MTKGRKNEERQLNQSLENRRDDENFNENFKCSQLNQSLENRRRSANFNGRLNQSMENRGDDSETQPVHGEKMQRPIGVIHIYFSPFNE